MLDLSQVEIQALLLQVEQAIVHHERWHRELTRTLLCQLPCDSRDLADDAHRLCRFGQWYDSDATHALRANAAFIAAGTEHVRMHQMAARLLRAWTSESFTPADYDVFAESLDRLRPKLVALEHELEEAIFNRDPLTDAESRAGMLGRLRELLELGRRHAMRSSIAMMDLDHFKAINDGHGHGIGDRVLAGAVRYLKQHLRPYDNVYRYGGEEFLISLPNADAEVSFTVVERMREGLAAEVLASDGGTAIRVSASFGIAELDPATSVEEAIERADHALYAAKAGGRNCVRLWAASGPPVSGS